MAIRLRSIILAVMLGLVIAAHLALSRLPSSYSGPLLILDNLFTILAVLYLVALAAGMGQLLLSRCRIVFRNPLELLVFDIAMGIGVLGTTIFLLCVVVGLKASMLVLLLVGATILLRHEIGQLPETAPVCEGDTSGYPIP